MEGGDLNRRSILLAVAVATAGVLPAFLTGGLAVQMRGELGFGAAALGRLVDKWRADWSGPWRRFFTNSYKN
jgi:hypothetical protein